MWILLQDVIHGERGAPMYFKMLSALSRQSVRNGWTWVVPLVVKFDALAIILGRQVRKDRVLPFFLTPVTHFEPTEASGNELHPVRDIHTPEINSGRLQDPNTQSRSMEGVFQPSQDTVRDTLSDPGRLSRAQRNIPTMK